MLQPLLSGKRLKWPRLNLGLKVSQAFSFVPRDQKLEPGSRPEVCPVPPDMQTPRKDFHIICTLLCFLIRRNRKFPFRGSLVEQGIHPSSPPAAPPGYQKRLERVMKL